MPPRRVAVLDCEDSERWRGWTEKLWREALEEPGDAWTVYQACTGELPTPEEAATYDAIIVGGSHYSVYEQADWIPKLLHALKQYAALTPGGPRVYGCCFGCQALAQALGGSVGPNPDQSFTLTIERVTLDPQAAQFPKLHAVLQQALADANGSSGSGSAGDGSSSSSADTVVERLAGCSISGSDGSSSSSRAAQGPPGDGGDDAPPSSGCSAGGRASGAEASEEGHASQSGQCCFRLMESHGDQVLQLPPGARTLATSRTARHELWSWGSQVLASQFHVEFTEPLVLEKIWPRLTDNSRLTPEQSAASRAVLEAGGQHNAELLGVVWHFLAHGVC